MYSLGLNRRKRLVLEKGNNPDPTDVNITNTSPVPVVVAEETLQLESQITSKQLAAAARVDAEILRTEDQRRISGIWEGTQQRIALSVVWVALFVVSILVLSPIIVLVVKGSTPEFAVTASVAGMLFLTGIANLVIGFYFGRTNHTRVGGEVVSGDDKSGR